MKIHLIRHSTLILHLNNKKILVDPILSPKGTISAIKNVPNTSNNPLVDITMPIDSIVECDAVLITHTHRDHFDDIAAKSIPKEITVFCQPEDEGKIKEQGFLNVIPINESYEWDGIKFDRTNGKHGHGVIALKMAPVSGFIISASGEPTIYLTGDTVWCSCVEKALSKYMPEVVISYCGEARFSLCKPITMNSQDILTVCKKTPRAKVVAVHMEAWNHCRLSRKALRDFTIENNIDRMVYIPLDGELLEF